MYYFKLPVFTKLSRIQNIIILSFQLIILIISISISLYRGCSYESNKFIDGCNVFNILSGNLMVTNRSYSSWQFLNPIKYSSKTLSELYNIKYINIMNTTLDEYLLFKGTIVLFDENKNNYDAIFKDSLAQLAYDDDFSYYFNKSVNMNNEIYRIVIDNGFFEIKFLNNCSTNSVLFEKNGKCIFQNNTYEDINKLIL